LTMVGRPPNQSAVSTGTMPPVHAPGMAGQAGLPEDDDNPFAGVAPTPRSRRKKKGKTGLIIGVVVGAVGLVGAGVGVYALTQSGGEEKNDKGSPENAPLARVARRDVPPPPAANPA